MGHKLFEFWLIAGQLLFGKEQYNILLKIFYRFITAKGS